jgi:hypothetical protein
MDSKRRWVLILVLLVSGLFKGSVSMGQSVEEAFDETSFVSVEQTINLDGASGIFLIDGSRTKNGRDFYEYLYQQWLTIQSDTTLISAAAFNTIGEELTVSIDEQPVPGGIGTSTVVSLTVNDVLIYQQFLQPRLEVVEQMAQEASGALVQYIQNYQEFQTQLGSEDQQGNGIF